MTPQRAKTILTMIGLATEVGVKSRHVNFTGLVCRGVGANFKIKESEVNDLLNMRLIDIIILITGRASWVTRYALRVETPATAAEPSPSAPTAGRSRSDSTTT